MPLVLATGAATASGIVYDDVFGLRYEFPIKYSDMVVAGEVFVYYTGIRGVEYRRPVYLGVGVIGEVQRSRKPGHRVAHVHDLELFGDPVSIKDADGNYFETGSVKGTNWPNGVRRISEASLGAILEQAGARISPTTGAGSKAASRGHAPPEHASRLERYSVRVALQLLQAEFGPGAVEEMPPGNPGYDVRVATKDVELHVEVKGTILQEPVFHLSEGQRRYAESKGRRFRLVVVYAVDLHTRTHKVAVVEGPLDSSVDLAPEAWTGRIRGSAVGASTDQSLD